MADPLGLSRLVELVGIYVLVVGGAGTCWVLIYGWLRGRESSYALEGACLASLASLVAAEWLLGLFDQLLTLGWMLAMLPILLWCLLGPLEPETMPVLLEAPDTNLDVLLLEVGDGRYLALGAVEVAAAVLPQSLQSGGSGESGIPITLVALEQETERAGVTFTYEVEVDPGAGHGGGGEARVAPLLWVAAQHKCWQEAVSAVRHALNVVEATLTPARGFATRRLEGEALSKAHARLGWVEGVHLCPGRRVVVMAGGGCVGLLRVDVAEQNYPEGFEESGKGEGVLARLVQELLARRVPATLMVSFFGGKLPKVRLPAQMARQEGGFPVTPVRLPRQLEEYLFADTLRQLDVAGRCRATGCFSVSVYLFVWGATEEQVEQGLEVAAAVVRGAAPGVRVVEQSARLQRVRFRRGLVMRRLLSGGRVASGATLLSWLALPPSLPGLQQVTVAPSFSLPSPSAGSGEGLALGWALWEGRPAQPVHLAAEDLVLHLLVLGESGFGKTRLVAHLVGQVAEACPEAGLLLFDLKGEYAGLLRKMGVKFSVYTPGGGRVPLRMNIFDPQGLLAGEHALRLVGLFQDNLRQALGEELSPLGVRLLREALTVTVAAGPKGWSFERLFREIDTCARHLRGRIREVGQAAEALKNRLLRFGQGVLGGVLAAPPEGSLQPEELLGESTVVDLSGMLGSGCSRADLRLLINLVLDRILRHNLNLSGHERGLRGLIVVEEAHILQIGGSERSSSLAELALLARSAGLGLVLVAQRPAGIPEEVLANAGTRIVFRSPYDARQLARYLNLTEEQEEYLRVLPRREAVVLLPRFGQPVLLQTPQVPDPEPEGEPENPPERPTGSSLSSASSLCLSPSPLPSLGDSGGSGDTDLGGVGRLARALMSGPRLVSALQGLAGGAGEPGEPEVGVLVGLGLAKRAGKGFRVTRLGCRVLKAVHSLRNLDLAISVDGWEGSAPASGAGPHPGAKFGAAGGTGKGKG